MRGLAAFIVCLGHWRYLFFLDYPQLTAHRNLWLIPYAVCTLGHTCVIVFFVLSGYLVGGSILRSVESSNWSWTNYLVQRGVRLYVVLLPALLLGGAFDYAALQLHLYPALYAGTASSQIKLNVASGLGLGTFLANIAFLQNIAAPVFGSNTPLWSLANEFWYYVMFPLGLLAITRKRQATPCERLLMLTVCVALAALVRKPILLLFPWWLLGAFLATLIQTYPARQNLTLPEKMAHELARFSYTLYLVHFPMLMFAAGLVGHREDPNDLNYLFIALAALGATLGSAYCVATATEFRTEHAKRFLVQHASHLYRSLRNNPPEI